MILRVLFNAPLLVGIEVPDTVIFALVVLVMAGLGLMVTNFVIARGYVRGAGIPLVTPAWYTQQVVLYALQRAWQGRRNPRLLLLLAIYPGLLVTGVLWPLLPLYLASGGSLSVFGLLLMLAGAPAFVTGAVRYGEALEEALRKAGALERVSSVLLVRHDRARRALETAVNRGHLSSDVLNTDTFLLLPYRPPFLYLYYPDIGTVAINVGPTWPDE